MVDSKISQTAEKINPELTDLIPIVDITAAPDETKRVFLSNLLKLVYPVGSIYISTVATNPATLFGFGTWAAFGAGKVLVGLDGTQAEFDTVEETGGEKTHALTIAELAAHNHICRVCGDEAGGFGLPEAPSFANRVFITGGGVAAVVDSTGNGDAHTNLQPYVVVYMWKRTA